MDSLWTFIWRYVCKMTHGGKMKMKGFSRKCSRILKGQDNSNSLLAVTINIYIFNWFACDNITNQF